MQFGHCRRLNARSVLIGPLTRIRVFTPVFAGCSFAGYGEPQQRVP
jgi:hypothetical protein